MSATARQTDRDPDVNGGCEAEGVAATELEEGESALARAEEAYQRFDIEPIISNLSVAVRAFTAAGDNKRAAMTCVRLGDVMTHALGNLTAGRAWFARARRLLADEPPCLEQGWAALGVLGCDVDDPAELLAGAELALDRARRFGDVNLETRALADAGLAHVQAGRVVEGMALLDEAMALVCGPADDFGNTAKSVCSFYTACYHTADFERAGSWTDLFRQQGLLVAEPGSGAFLSSHCDSVQAALLIELGRWSEAEEVLERARREYQAVMPGPARHPDLVLAELRIHQGRLGEAEELLVGRDQFVQALIPAARLHLARGDHDLAVAAARRGLRVVAEDRVRVVALLVVLTEAELASGDLEGAQAACEELARRTADLDLPALRARSAGAQARVLAAEGDPAAAVALLEPVLDQLDPRQLPWLRAHLLVELCDHLEQAGDAPAARLAAGAARAALGGLDVVLPPDAVAVLDRCGTPRPAAAATRSRARLARDGKWWTASFDGASVRLADTKGLRYVAELVARPGVERHVLDLVDRVEGVDTDGLDRRKIGDAGPLLDARARDEYRHRIEELRSDIDDALELQDFDTAERRQAELDRLVGELARAFGLGDRSRAAASTAERARLNVTRALRAATAKLSEAMPRAGAALDRHVRTGTYCIYQPVPDDVEWIVQS
jgi:tetratricopeptide (TPR) repeat protein